MQDAQSLILEEIEKINSQKKQVKNRIMICCPFHDDRTPSCGIVVAEDTKYQLGSFNCLGCGAHGDWNLLADKIGLRTVHKLAPKEGAIQTGALKIKLREMDTKLMSDSNYNMNAMLESLGSPATNPWPEQAEWRGYPGWLIRKIGGLAAVGGRKERMTDIKCYLPVHVGRKIVGMIKARTRKVEGQLSYVSSEGDWTKESGLFPYNLVNEMLGHLKRRYVFIVEGPRDALRLIMSGIPALAILGSQNMSGKKLKLLERLDVEYVFVLPDNDSAGTALKKKLKWYRDNMELGYKFVFYSLPKDKDKEGKLIKMDPDGMPKSMMSALKEELRELGLRSIKLEKIK